MSQVVFRKQKTVFLSAEEQAQTLRALGANESEIRFIEALRRGAIEGDIIERARGGACLRVTAPLASASIRKPVLSNTASTENVVVVANQSTGSIKKSTYSVRNGLCPHLRLLSGTTGTFSCEVSNA